ncbi:hypothetical protein K220099C10_19210 [Bacteroides thetaiotaomicron]|uniref:hypothetical protein n=1 Tax=Bacteroides thetaiotaomicron TaxID=818 RepID=UPI0034C474DA
MKEYVAETGGRYTYADDILNLQELALSMTSIFSECTDFIISGCIVSGNAIASGYVWLNGKVRYFEGCPTASFPYYIYERNLSDTVTYANEMNKKGRNNFLCLGGTIVPDTPDTLTGKLPHFIEIRKEYAPRFIDKFIGKYAVLVDTPFSKQTIRKDLVITGKLGIDKTVESQTALTVVNPANSYSFKGIVKVNGDASWGAYYNGLLVNEILLQTDGSIHFIKQGTELAYIDTAGIFVPSVSCTSLKTGSLVINKNSIANYDDEKDTGAVNINVAGYKNGNTKFRDFNVYDGKKNTLPLIQTVGKERKVNIAGNFSVKAADNQLALISSSYLKGDSELTGSVRFKDSSEENIAEVGYIGTDNFDFSISNMIGNLILNSTGSVNVQSDLQVKGTSLTKLYVSAGTFKDTLAKKVDIVLGKGLSSEDFTTEYKKKLDAITSGNIDSGEEGYVTTANITEALKKKLNISYNLSDLNDKSIARTNLQVFSKTESNNRFLKTEGKLLELVSLTADEINGLSAEQAAQLKDEKQAQIRLNINAEKKGTEELKLSKSSNLSDLSDKGVARKNMSVYSVTEIDKLLAGKLNTDAAYTGANFTDEMKQKLETIKGGSFAYVDDEGTSHAEVEGFVMTSQVKKELAKKAERLLTGYNDSEKNSIASNINVYSKTEADKKYASVNSLFQDYITLLVSQGKSSSDAQKVLRDKLNVLSKEDVTGHYLKKDGKLSDLSLPNADAKKSACQNIGAAYAPEYQTKIADTGWKQMANSGSGTDTRRLFVRQIGNIVCIQGVINTARRDGSNMGGTVAILPNGISTPPYGMRTTLCDWNDDAKYNRGTSFILRGGTRNIVIYESGWYNVDTDMNFTYMV